MELKLFMWAGFKVANELHTIYAVAENLEKAKAVAVEKAAGNLKEQVKAHVQNVGASEYNEPDSFIFKTGGQLI